MPASTHEIPLALLDERPAMLLELLRAAGGPQLESDEVVPVRESFADLAPATYAADRVYLAKQDDRPVAAFVVELQRRVDPDKQWSWPVYLASAHARLRVATWLVVVTLDENVAGWAARPIATCHGGALAPLVVGPEQIPRDIDGASLELMVLATMAHGQGSLGGARAVRTLTEVRLAGELEHLDDVRMRLYTDLVLASIDGIARSYVEALMIDIKNWQPQSDWAKHWKNEGLTEGRSEGRTDGLRAGVRAVCDVLGIPWTSAQDERVAHASADELETLLLTIRRERRWPD
jgi:hypothetical protein